MDNYRAGRGSVSRIDLRKSALEINHLQNTLRSSNPQLMSRAPSTKVGFGACKKSCPFFLFVSDLSLTFPSSAGADAPGASQEPTQPLGERAGHLARAGVTAGLDPRGGGARRASGTGRQGVNQDKQLLKMQLFIDVEKSINTATQADSKHSINQLNNTVCRRIPLLHRLWNLKLLPLHSLSLISVQSM